VTDAVICDVCGAVVTDRDPHLSVDRYGDSMSIISPLFSVEGHYCLDCGEGIAEYVETLKEEER